MKRPLFLLSLALLLLAPRLGETTTVKRLTHPQLVGAAAEIVHGDCLEAAPEWDSSHRRIFTRVRFAVREQLKGEGGSTMELLVPGGEIGGVSYVIHGMPTFEAGEEVVVYATAAHPKSKVKIPVGLDQGCYRIRRAQSVAPAARRDMRQLILAEPGKRPARGRAETVPLDDLLQRIRSEVASQKKSKRK